MNRIHSTLKTLQKHHKYFVSDIPNIELFPIVEVDSVIINITITSVQVIAIIGIFFKCIVFNLQHMFCNNKGLEDDDHMPRGEELCVPLCYSLIILGSRLADHLV